MKRFVSVCFFCLVLVGSLLAESKNMEDYPLRIHIFSISGTNFYYWRSIDESKGEGRANLFANDDVRGIDFAFECGQKPKASFGFETYPARWKKPNQELTVLFPVFGQTNAYWTCNLKTDVKDFAYLRHNGHLSSEPSTEFKAWMQRHDYDPEHGKSDPINLKKPVTDQATSSPGTK